MKHKEACPLSLVLQRKQLDICTFPLTAPGFKTNHEKWVESMRKMKAATGLDIDKETYDNLVADQGICHA